MFQQLQWLLKFTLSGLFFTMTYLTFKKRDKLATGRIEKKMKSGNNGVQISKNNQLTREDTQAHVLVTAPTRTGKTTTILIPNLLKNDIKGSIIVYDPSLEIYKQTAKYQKSIGRKVILYNPLSGEYEYNLLEQCKNENEIIELAQSLLINGSLAYELSSGQKSGGAEWLALSQNLLSACLITAKEQYKNIKYALELIVNYDDEERINFLSKNERCIELYNAYLKGSETGGLKASINATITSNLSLFFNDLKINKSSFTAEMLRKINCILYISYPEHKARYLSPLMATIYTQIINKFIEINGKDITFFLDEFANLGRILNFDTIISTAAKRKIAFILFLQDFNQLIKTYGKSALTIWNNCNTKVFLSGITDLETLKMASFLCGETEITVNNNKIKKPLLSPSEIRRMDRNKCLILNRNLQPVIDETNYK